MKKVLWKGGNMLYPVPPVLVTVADGEGNDNVFTVAWTGTVCTNPPMLSISVKEQRYSFGMLVKDGGFVVHLPAGNLVRAIDFCGVKSGRDIDKFEAMGLTRRKALHVAAPLIAEAPVAIECRVCRQIPLGSHHLFLADVLAVHVDEKLIDPSGYLCLEKAGLVAYSHGRYYELGRALGSFGYSVRREKRGRGGKAGREEKGRSSAKTGKREKRGSDRKQDT